MATIPSVMDYGARPSLRSNRVDLPGSGNMVLADSLARAANTFAAEMKARGEKRDRLNYALAKNAILQADIEGREKLKGREDHENFDEEYSTGFYEARDKIIAERRLDPDDAALLNAESDLIGTRGRVAVGEYGRTVKIDQALADLNEDLIDAQKMMNTPTGNATRNDIMLTALEAIEGALEKGYFGDNGDVKAQALREEFVQDAALSSLSTMDPKLREQVLEASLAHRKAGGPLTAEDIRAGKGTGSIADFLHADTATRLLEETRNANEDEDNKAAVFAVIDQARINWPETDKASIDARNKYMRQQLTDPDQRAMGETEMSQINNQDIGLDALGLEEIFDAMAALIDDKSSFAGLPSDEVSKLSAQQQSTLRTYAYLVQTNNGFGEIDDPDMEYVWRTMTSAEKAGANLNSPNWKIKFKHETWRKMLLEADAHRNATVTNKDPNIYRGDPDDEVLRGMLYGKGGFFPKEPKKGDENYKVAVAIDSAVNRALVDESLRRYLDPKINSGYLLPQDVREITAEVLKHEVFVRRFGTDVRTVAAAVTEEQKPETYIPIKKWRNKIQGTDSMGEPQTYEQYLRKLVPNKNLSDNDLEEAYYYLSTLPKTEGEVAAEARLRDEPGY